MRKTFFHLFFLSHFFIFIKSGASACDPAMKCSQDMSIHFDFNQSQVSEKSRPLLNGVIARIKKHPEFEKVIIGGHADRHESSPAKLAEDRALAVRKSLIDGGVQLKLEIINYRDERPLGPPATKEGQAQNR